MKRLFIGIPLSGGIKTQIKPLLEELLKTGADLNLISSENLHLTVKFLGNVNESEINLIKEKLSSLKIKKFSVLLEKIGVFPSSERLNVIWIGLKSKELIALMKEVEALLQDIRKNEHEELIPHLTLARVKSSRNKEELQQWLKKAEKTSFGEMLVDKMILYESELTGEGPVYKELGEIKFSH